MVSVTPRLSKLLNERGMTQMELSVISGVPQGSISRFDKNDRHVDAHVAAIMLALDVTYEELFVIEYDERRPEE